MSKVIHNWGQNRWYILLFLLIICISATIGLFLIEKQKQTLIATTTQQLQSISQLKSSRIHEWRHTITGIAETLKNRPSLLHDCTAFIKKDRTSEVNERLKDQFTIMRQVFQAKGVYLITTGRTTVYSTDQGQPCDPHTISELSLHKQRNTTPLLSDLYLDSHDEVLIT
jgi:LPS O-antigen subunit length determinant protein (WzzB/FepE family)